MARVARVNSSLCTRAHARMHEKNLHLPLPPLPDEVIGRKALLGVGFRGKGKSPAGLPSPLPPLPLPLPLRAYGRVAGASRGTFGWSQRQHQNPPWREIALARNHRRWQKPGSVLARQRQRVTARTRQVHSCRDAPLSGGLCVIVVARCSAPRSTRPASGGDSSLRTATRRRRVFKCLCSDVFGLRASAAYRSCSIHCSWRPPALVGQTSPPCCGSHA